MQSGNVIAALRRAVLSVWVPCAVLGVIIAYAFIRSTTTPAGVYVVSQKGRKFSVDSLDIAKGDTVRIINDDGNLRHHAYVSSVKFRFDSGDQEPGSTADINFPIIGDFDVMCGIHPKMRLGVHVR